jgi:hypothetical protein
MALFDSQEVKEEKKAQKLLEKEEAAFAKMSERYGFNELSETDRNSILKIYQSTTGNFSYVYDAFNMAFESSKMNAFDRMQTNMQRGMYEQNWVMINQLSRISMQLDKMISLLEKE